jgi:alpha-tubulin suppressor-like RCC1 family protein
VAGGHVFTKLAIASLHACGITSEADVLCWGGGYNGQLGIGSSGTSNVPVAPVGGPKAMDVSAGDAHTCIIDQAGAAFCWGSGGLGALGTGTLTDHSSPVAVVGGHTFASVNASRIGFRTCALTDSGQAYCWGDNQAGAVGDGTFSIRSSPVAVAGGLAFSRLAVGPHVTCGITGVGTTYCWGRNSHGHFGNSSFGGFFNTPVAAVSGTVLNEISLGATHACGVTPSGGGLCWGFNEVGQLGIGEVLQPITVPAAVAGGITFRVP